MELKIENKYGWTPFYADSQYSLTRFFSKANAIVASIQMRITYSIHDKYNHHRQIILTLKMVNYRNHSVTTCWIDIFGQFEGVTIR